MYIISTFYNLSKIEMGKILFSLFSREIECFIKKLFSFVIYTDTEQFLQIFKGCSYPPAKIVTAGRSA
jgi:hypothetical protein